MFLDFHNPPTASGPPSFAQGGLLYSYDNGNNIVRTIDIKNKKMYNYLYTDGIISQSVESDILLNESEFVTGKTVKATVRYIYNDEGTLTKKRIITADGEQVVSYTTAENESQMVKTGRQENRPLVFSKLYNRRKRIADGEDRETREPSPCLLLVFSPCLLLLI